MSVLAPPRPPRSDEPPETDALEALIEEARRRARRRRLRYAGAALIVLAAAIAALDGFSGRGGRERAPAPAQKRPPEIAPARAGEVENGPLTILDVKTNARHEGPAGWYAASSVGSDGRLSLLARCPDGDDWCGEPESVDWSPDGTWVALSVTSFGRANPHNGLHLINPATGEDRRIRWCEHPGECDWFDIDWSPDGTRLAYGIGYDIVVINTDGAGSRVLVDDPAGRARSPSWSPDGRWLAFDRRSNGVSSVYVIRADGTHRRLLVDDASAPAWSPLGTTIAYRTSCGVRLITPLGVDRTPPTPFRCRGIGIDGRPVWSPDGTKLAVAGTTTFGTGAPVRGTFVMNADGSGLARVTPKTLGVFVGSDPRPAWRPLLRDQ